MKWPDTHYATSLVGIHKPRGQLRREGVTQMTILLFKSYLVKVSTKSVVKNPKNLSTWFMDGSILYLKDSYFFQGPCPNSV